MNFSIKKIIVITLVVISIIAALLGCDSDSGSEPDMEFHKKNQLTTIYKYGISPLNIDFVKETTILVEVIKRFQSDATLVNLEEAQKQWKAIQKVWKQLELYDLGNIASSFISFEINRWPSDIQRIDTNIKGTQVLNSSFITSLGSSSKGISGIEYLLFSSIENTSVLDMYTTDTYASRRMEYLLALSEDLQTKSIALQALWQTHGDGFTTALENGISGSQNLVVNAMVALIEEVILSKLGKPLGDSNGGTVDTQLLEAYYSEFSKEILQQHLIALQMCYTGNFGQNTEQEGFDDILELIGSKDVADKLIEQFSVCQSAIDAIQGSLQEEIISKPAAVVALKNSFRDLLVLIKIDMANRLGTTITFNDNDGD
ncbi:imelysin family protein [Aquimarina sp. I32.4]|uniref:imelysin family protein n=1 Tax=Aquimarina sp. I32.4 TaxID=2053903 RepID=UPI000CDF2DC7|nr:imelysin family protein [Aquimarina sp. I32.4]